jgi:hypothetical protein
MVTKTPGGRITGLLALTVEAQVALEKEDPVMVTGDYEVGLADGTKPNLGHVSVANKAPVHGTATRPAEVPGVCTVEARGFYVRTILSDGAIAAGVGVAYGAAGALAAVAAGAHYDGIVLTHATAAGQKIDVLFT